MTVRTVICAVSSDVKSVISPVDILPFLKGTVTVAYGMFYVETFTVPLRNGTMPREQVVKLCREVAR